MESSTASLTLISTSSSVSAGAASSSHGSSMGCIIRWHCVVSEQKTWEIFYRYTHPKSTLNYLGLGTSSTSLSSEEKYHLQVIITFIISTWTKLKHSYLFKLRRMKMKSQKVRTNPRRRISILGRIRRIEKTTRMATRIVSPSRCRVSYMLYER